MLLEKSKTPALMNTVPKQAQDVAESSLTNTYNNNDIHKPTLNGKASSLMDGARSRRDHADEYEASNHSVDTMRKTPSDTDRASSYPEENDPDEIDVEGGGSGVPDGGWGWVVVFGCALAFFMGAGLSRSFTIIYQQLLEIFGEDAAATSATAAIFGAVKMCSSPLVSLLCAKFSKRSVAVFGGVVTCVGMLMSSFPLSLPYIYLTYGVGVAFGFNMVLTPSFVIIGEYFKKRRARAMSLAMIGGSLGGMSLPPLLNYLFSHYLYTGTMILLAGLTLNICVAGALFRPLKKKTHRNTKKVKAYGNSKADDAVDLEHQNGRDGRLGDTGGNLDSDSVHTTSDTVVQIRYDTSKMPDVSRACNSDETTEEAPPLFASPSLPVRQVSFQIGGDVTSNSLDTIIPPDTLSHQKHRQPRLHKCYAFFESIGIHNFRMPRFVIYSLLMVASILSLSISGVFLSGLVQELNLPKQYTSYLLMASAATDIPSKFASGFLFDVKKLRPFRSLLFGSMGFLTGVCTLCMGFTSGLVGLFIVYILYTLFASAYHTQHATVLADIVGSANLSGAMGLCRLCQGIGFIMGPTIGGHIKDSTGLYYSAYIFSGAILVISTMLYTGVELWFLRKQKHEHQVNIGDIPRTHQGRMERYRHDSISTVT